MCIVCHDKGTQQQRLLDFHPWTCRPIEIEETSSKFKIFLSSLAKLFFPVICYCLVLFISFFTSSSSSLFLLVVDLFLNPIFTQEAKSMVGGPNEKERGVKVSRTEDPREEGERWSIFTWWRKCVEGKWTLSLSLSLSFSISFSLGEWKEEEREKHLHLLSLE